MGFFDLGFNVYTVRLSGNPVIKISRTAEIGKRGNIIVTEMRDHEKSTDQHLNSIKKSYTENKGLAVLLGVETINFWNKISDTLGWGWNLPYP